MVDAKDAILGIDVGGGGARWRLAAADGGLLRAGEAPPFSGQLGGPNAIEAAERSVAEMRRAAGPAGIVAAGVTGLSSGTAEADALAEMLREAFGCRRVMVMGDIELAARFLARPGEAMLVYAGTGSIAACIDADGVIVTAGGKGVLIDDAGGGYWIAVAGLRHVLRAEDAAPGSAWPTPLGRAFARRFGGDGWADVRRSFYGLDRGGVGRLALAVAEAAREGDAGALAVLESAGRELALLARMLLARHPAPEVILAGRAASLHPAIAAAMARELQGITLTSVDHDAAAAAVALARSMR